MNAMEEINSVASKTLLQRGGTGKRDPKTWSGLELFKVPRVKRGNEPSDNKLPHIVEVTSDSEIRN